MDKSCGRIRISDYSFLKLLATSIILKGKSPIIINHRVEKDLYGLYDRDEYHFLFEDLCKKNDPTGENNYVDLNRAFEQAYAFGLFLPIRECQKEIRSIINLSEYHAEKLQCQYSKKQLDAMSQMCDEIFQFKINEACEPKPKVLTKTKIDGAEK